jgi:hypothetical protein
MHVYFDQNPFLPSDQHLKDHLIPSVFPKIIPAKISNASDIIEIIMPKAGTITTEISIKPDADPKRSALYVEPGAESDF